MISSEDELFVPSIYDDIYDGFTVAIDNNELDDIVANVNRIIIKISFSCYCYDNDKRITEFYIVENKEANYITNRNVIDCLILNNVKLNCNHQFIEGFLKQNDLQYEILLGS
jgi:hypothetical protein